MVQNHHPHLSFSPGELPPEGLLDNSTPAGGTCPDDSRDDIREANKRSIGIVPKLLDQVLSWMTLRKRPDSHPTH